MKGESIMKFSDLFIATGRDTEVEIYRDNPGQCLCSVTSVSWVPKEIYRAEVKSIVSAGLGRFAVIVGEEIKREYKD